MEADIERKYLLLMVVISSLSQRCFSQSDPCTATLANKVTYEGASASFDNVIAVPPAQWKVIPTSYQLGPNLINNDDYTIVDPFTATTYAVNQSQLTIFSSKVAPDGTNPYSTAGLYILFHPTMECGPAAGLVVIKSGPVCSCDPSNPNTLSCQVEFAEFSNQYIHPIMTWKDNNGVAITTDQPVPSQIDPDNNAGLYMSVSQFSVTNNGVGLYECQLTFSSDDFSQFATNAPDFTASCYISTCAPTTMDPTTTAAELTTLVARNCTGQNLTNTVVYEGVPTSFPRVNNGQIVQWQVAPSSVTFNALRNITDYTNVLPEFSTTYSVSGSQLTIFNATAEPGPQGSKKYSTAGIYTLRYLNPNCTTAANLIVIRKGPVCACNKTNLNNVTLSCNVTFAETSSQACYPIFKWMDSAGGQVKLEQPIPSQINTYTRKSTSQLAIAGSDTTTYVCQLTFGAPPMSPLAYMAPAAPIFNATCSVSCV